MASEVRGTSRRASIIFPEFQAFRDRILTVASTKCCIPHLEPGFPKHYNTVRMHYQVSIPMGREHETNTRATLKSNGKKVLLQRHWVRMQLLLEIFWVALRVEKPRMSGKNRSKSSAFVPYRRCDASGQSW